MKKPAISGAVAVAAGLAAAVLGRVAFSLRRPASPATDTAPSSAETAPVIGPAVRLESIMDRLSRMHGKQLSDDARHDILARSASWQRAIASDVAGWLDWLEEISHPKLLGIDDLADYMMDGRNRGMRDATLRRRVSSIATANRMIGVEHFVWSVVTRHPTMRPKRPTGSDANLLRVLINQSGDDLKGLRDAAIVAIGHAVDLKSKEIAQISTEDFIERDGEVLVKLPGTATKRQGRSETKITPEALMLIGEWAKAANIASGRVFRRIEPVRKGRATDDAILGDAITGPGTTYIVLSLYDRAVARGVISPADPAGLRTRLRNEPLGGVLGGDGGETNGAAPA